MILFYGWVLSVPTHDQHDKYVFTQANAIKFITLKPETAQRVQKISNRFWLAGILFSITHAVFKVDSRHPLHAHFVILIHPL